MHFRIDIRPSSPAKVRANRCIVGRPSMLWTHLRRAFCPNFRLLTHSHGFQSGHPQQVIGSSDKVSRRLSSFYPQAPCPPKPAHRLDPPKNFLHSLANAQTGLAPRALGDALVQSRHLDSFLAGDVRCDVPLAAPGRKRFLMVAFVRPHRLRMGSRMQEQMLVQLVQGHDRLALGDGIVNGKIGAQPVAISIKTWPPKQSLASLPAAFL